MDPSEREGEIAARLAQIEATIRTGVYPELIDLAWLCSLIANGYKDQLAEVGRLREAVTEFLEWWKLTGDGRAADGLKAALAPSPIEGES